MSGESATTMSALSSSGATDLLEAAIHDFNDFKPGDIVDYIRNAESCKDTYILDWDAILALTVGELLVWVFNFDHYLQFIPFINVFYDRYKI